jgi:hypothetical protein
MCAAIGVRTRELTLGTTIGPRAENEYAVDPCRRRATMDPVGREGRDVDPVDPYRQPGRCGGGRVFSTIYLVQGPLRLERGTALVLGRDGEALFDAGLAREDRTHQRAGVLRARPR